MSKTIQELNDLTTKLSDLKQKFNAVLLNKLNNDFEERTLESERLTKDFLETKVKLNSLEAKLSEIQKLIGKMSQLKTCPTCLQSVSNDHKNHIFDQAEKEIGKINYEIDNLKRKRKTCQSWKKIFLI